MQDLGRPTAPQPDSSSPAAEASVRNAQTQGGTPAPARERRKPRISETPPAAPPAPRLADYESIIGKSQVDELRFVASPLRGKRSEERRVGKEWSRRGRQRSPQKETGRH